jgi:8-oxo-dGTP pyrophosphatase MutT (NUDIX family)
MIYRTLDKVTAFVTRENGDTKELLVFKHPTAGIQLPAGTVNIDEAPETTVLREVWEETGLQNVTIAGKLGTQESELPTDKRYILRPTKLFDAPSFDASSDGFVLFRGHMINHVADHGQFSAVFHAEYNHNVKPPQLLFREDGYVRQSLLTRHLTRHFYHLPTHSPTPDTWTLQADGHLFTCFWTPLSPKPTLLIEPQQSWLDNCYSALIK